MPEIKYHNISRYKNCQNNTQYTFTKNLFESKRNNKAINMGELIIFALVQLKIWKTTENC